MVARTSKEVTDQFEPLWQQGLTTRAIGDRVGVAATTVTKYLVAAGIDVAAESARRRYLVDQKSIEEIVRRYQAGEKLNDLADMFGYASHVSVLKLLQRRGVPARKREWPERELTDADIALIKRRKAEGVPDATVAKEIGCDYRIVARWLKRNGYRDDWHNGIRKLNDGYVGQWVQPDHPFYCMADHQGTVRQHRLVMAEALGRPLLKSETVHHINGKRDDNRLENLQLRQNAHGPGVQMACLDCGSHRIAPVPLSAS